MPVIIETPMASTEYYWTQITSLDGVPYELSFRFNSREQVYYLQISTLDGVPQVGGVKLVSNWPLLRTVNNPLAPPGELIASGIGSDAPAGFGELGSGARVSLQYFSLAELIASGEETWRNPGFAT